MKRLLRSLIFALFGLILSLSLVRAEPPIPAQNAPLALVQAGKDRYDRGQFSEAVGLLQQAAQDYEAAGNVPKQAQALGLLSLAYQKLGQWEAAESAIASSLSLLETLPRNSEPILAQVLNARGRLQLATGDAEAALATWKETEAIYAQAGDTVGILGSQINQAEAMQALGLYRRAQQLFERIEETLNAQPDSPLKATGLHNLGNLLRQAGDLDRSEAVLRQSLAIAQNESDVLLSLGNTERVLAKRAEAFNNRRGADAYTQEALAHYQQAAATATAPTTKIQAQLNQLSLAIEDERSTTIEALLPEISEALSELPPSRASVYADVNFAESLMKLPSIDAEQRTTIVQLLNRAAEQGKDLEDRRAESHALGTLGKWYETTQDWSNARKFTQSALLAAQQLNAPDIAYQWQWQMGRLLQTQAETATGNTQAVPEAIAYYTEAFKTLNKLRADLVALNPDIQFSFRESVEPVYRQLVDLLLRSPQPSQENLRQARDVLEALQIAELDNFFRDACAQPEAVNVDNIDRTAAIVYPIILEDRLEVILKLPGTDNLNRYGNQGVSERQVDRAVARLRSSLTRATISLNQVQQESKQLYDWLLEPFAAELESAIAREQSQIKTLVFVLDGSMRNLPMAALYDGERYLIERYAVAVTPSLQLLEPKPLQRENLRALIAGVTNAPSFQEEGFGPLDNVAIELSGIEEQISLSEILEDREFVRENLQEQLNSAPFNVVHIATHGQFSSNPQRTFLLDWNKRIQVNDLDSLLRLDNPSERRPIELLTLSACETARGDKRAALGLAGVAIRAGARSTLATLWQVNDASTAQFMIQFYQQLSNPSLTKAEALRNVQLAFLAEGSSTDFNRPYYWAPFILVGNWL